MLLKCLDAFSEAGFKFFNGVFVLACLGGAFAKNINIYIYIYIDDYEYVYINIFQVYLFECTCPVF